MPKTRAAAASAAVLLSASAAHATCPTWTNLTNGTTADATAVMGNFNAILQCPNFTGNVGIGVGSPQYALDLSTAAAGTLRINSTDTYYGVIMDLFSAQNVGDTIRYMNGNGSAGWTTGYNVSSGNFLFSVGANAAPFESAAVLALTQSGHVGVGNIAPAGTLHVSTMAGFQTTDGLVVNHNGIDGGRTAATFYYTTGDGSTAFSGRISPINNGGLAFSYGSRAAIGSETQAEVMRITNGNVGIGTTSPGYTLDVAGTIRGSNVTPSDRRLKTDIQTLDSSGLGLVRELRPVTFSWKHPTDPGMRGRQIGFIAQEVQKVLPDVVVTGADAASTLSVKYDELIPILTKAVQDLDAANRALEAENAADKQAVEDLKIRHQADAAALRGIEARRQVDAAKLQAIEAKLEQLERRIPTQTAAN